MHCPSDPRHLKTPSMAGYSGEGAYRSYSIIHNAGAANEWIGGTTKVAFTNKYICKKQSEIKNPGSKYFIVEEADGRGYNMGSWVTNWDTPGDDLIDPISVFHNGRSTLGFADGHAQRYVWQDKDTIKYAADILSGAWPGPGYHYTDPNPPNPDIQYLKRNFMHN